MKLLTVPRMDDPPTKPTNVPDRKPSKTNNPPAKTEDKGPKKSCSVKGGKRAQKIEDRYFLDSLEFKKLMELSGKTKNEDWQTSQDNKGFALQLSVSCPILVLVIHDRG